MATNILPTALHTWFETEVARWRRSEAFEQRRNPGYHGMQADWLDAVGRPRFTQFVFEYRLVKPVPLRNPFLTLTRSYRSASASRASGVYDGATHYEVNKPGQLPWVDHPEMWRTTDGEIIFTSFPYQVDADECATVAKSNGLLVEIRPDLNFYHDRATCVVWRAW